MIHCSRLSASFLHPETCILRQTLPPKFDSPFCLPCPQGLALLEGIYFLEGKTIKPIVIGPKPKKYQICPSCGQEKNRRYWKVWVCNCPESEKRIEAIRAKRNAKYYERERTSDKPIRKDRKYANN